MAKMKAAGTSSGDVVEGQQAQAMATATRTDQCYLIGRMEELAKLNGKVSYNNFTHLNNPNPANTVNSFFSFTSIVDLYNITTDEYAHLVPLMQLSIVHRSLATKEEVARTDVPVQGTYIDPEELLANPASRSQTLGFKSFDFTFDGKNPYTAKKLIKAKATFYSDTLTVFSKKPFITMLRMRDDNNHALEHLYKVGWAVPTNMKNKRLRNVMHEANMQLTCQYISHTFDVQQDGTFVLTIEYIASVDRIINQIDILHYAKEVNEKRVRDQSSINQKFNKFSRNKAERKVKKEALEQIETINEHQAQYRARLERVIAEKKDYLANKEYADDEHHHRTTRNARNLIEKYEQELKAMENDGFGIGISEFQSTNIERRRTGLERAKSILSGTGKFNELVTAEAANQMFDTSTVDEFLAGYPEDQRAVWRDYLVRQVTNYNMKAKTVTEVSSTNDSSTKYTESFAAYTKRQHTEKMKIRNSDAFKILITKLEGVKPDGSDSKIQNLFVEKGQFIGDLQTYQALVNQIPLKEESALISSQPAEPEPIMSTPDGQSQSSPPQETLNAISETGLQLGSGEVEVKRAALAFSGKIDVSPNESGKIAVPFFYFGDLFNILAEIADSQVKDKKIQFILGSMPYTNPATKKTQIVSIADIPISVRAFQAFMHKNYIAKYTGLRLPLFSFISNVFTQLLRPAFSNECFTGLKALGAEVNRFSMNYKTLHKPVQKGRLSLSGLIKAVETRGTNVECILFSANMDPGLATGGNYQDDIKKGIFHFHMGRDRGLLKQVSFSKYDIPYLKAHRMTMDDAGPIDRAQEPYKADLELIGNNLLYPGSIFYVTPSVPGGEAAAIARKLGIGGYYMAHVVEHSITPASYTTRVKGLIGDQAIIRKGFKPSSTTMDQKTNQDADSLREEAAKAGLAKQEEEMKQFRKDIATKAETADKISATQKAALNAEGG